jgi:two-component system, response regulator YesN
MQEVGPIYTIVLVDDEFMIKRSLSKLIEISGEPFQVVGEAEDGREALELVERYSPDLLITDIRMPFMDGLELIEAVKANQRTTEIVILSGYDDFGYAQKALRMGVFDYLLKPIKPPLFYSMLQRLKEKLTMSQLYASKRSEWLLFSKVKLETLSEQLWLLNRDAVMETVEAMHADYTADDPSPRELKERYADLLTLLIGELESRSKEPLASAAFDMAGWPDSPSELFDTVRQLLDELMEELRSGRKWGTHHHLHKSVAYMKDHFADPTLDLQRVAEVAEMSPSYFSRVFKQELGTSFVLYLTQLRLDQAKVMLEDAHCKTYEIALRIGYEDYPHFAKLFKKHTGVTPTDYRKRLGIK